MSNKSEQKNAKYSYLGQTQIEKVRLLQEDQASLTRDRVAETISDPDSPLALFNRYYRDLHFTELPDEERAVGLHYNHEIPVPKDFKIVVQGPEATAICIDFGFSEIINKLINDPETSAETLHRIAISSTTREDMAPDVTRRRVIIEHPNVSSKTLNFLSKCDSKRNKLMIIDHPKVQPETLQAMAENDPDKNVREAARKKLEEKA